MSSSEYDVRISGTPIQEITDVHELSDRYTRERSGDFSDPRLARKLGSLTGGELTILSKGISKVSLGPRDVQPVALLEAPELGRTRHESRLGVLFGQLAIGQAQRETIPELVAVKYTSSRLAAREYLATHAVHTRISPEHAYTPIGFLHRDDDYRYNTGYITRYQHETTTLDAIFWNPEATREQRMAGVARASIWLATLHNHGISHGDAEPKNIAHISADTPFYVDLETARDLYDPTIFPGSLQLSDISDFLQYQEEKLSGEEFATFLEIYLDAKDANDVSSGAIREQYDKPLATIHHFAAKNK